MMIRTAFAALAAIGILSLASAPAHADFNADIQACQGSPGTGVAWQAAVDACGRLLNSGRFSNDKLAIVYFYRAHAYSNMGQRRSAIADYSQSITLDPSNESSWYNRGVNYSELKDYNSALPDYTKAIALKPADEDAWYNRAKTYSALGEKRRAIADLDQALKLKPNDADAMNNRASAYRELGEYDEAIAGYRHALRVDPNHAESYYGLSLIERKQGHIKQADKDLAKARALNRAGKD